MTNTKPKAAKTPANGKTRPAKTRLETKKAGAEGQHQGKVAESDTNLGKVSKMPEFDRGFVSEVSKGDTSAKPQKQVMQGVGNPNSAEAGKATRFQPGVSPNPGGKPAGARNRLQGDFMRELCEDFSQNGRAAIIACRTEKPDVYVKVIASLMPKELEIKRPLEELSEDELIAGVDALRSFLTSKGAGIGTATETQRKQTH